MGITTQGLSVCAAALAGSYGGNFSIGIGIGSTAFASGNTTLVSETDRNMVDTYNLGIAKQVIMIANWSPVDISGTILQEFGTFTTGSTMLNREVTTGSFEFFGEQELQIQQTILFTIV